MNLHEELHEIGADIMSDLDYCNRAIQALTEDDPLTFIKFLVDSVSAAARQVPYGDEESGVTASCFVYGFLIGREHGRRGYTLTDMQ